MCGLFLNIASESQYSSSLNFDMFARLQHRGIDNSSFVELSIENKIFMGHHRLSINDLSHKANQPFKTNCEKYYLLFNGEVFNFKDLKKDIDYEFNTQSDTEVIIAGYKKFGKDFLKKLEGFFSIVILDIAKNIVIATVDPTSVKSLYYELNDKSISISSELNSFFCKSKIIENLNLKALQIYLQYGYVHAPESIMKNVYKLEPGELIEFNLYNFQKTNCKKYNKHYQSKNNKKFKDLIIESHKSRLTGDVPIATMLSGGVDSTLSNVIYSNIFKNSENVYTLGLKDSAYDESKLALEQTKKLKLDHKILNIHKSEIIDEFKILTKYLDEPFADSSSILVSLLSKQISKKYKVVISSDGGDELLFGYSRHRFFFIFFWICLLPKNLKKILKKLCSSRLFSYILEKLNISHFEIKINKFLSLLEQSNISTAYMSLIKIMPDQNTKKIMKEYQGDTIIKNLNSSYGYKSVKEIDYNFYLPSINFKNDRCGMQHSLEIREPLLNYELVRYKFNQSMKFIDLFYPKKIFRKFLKKNQINIARKKHGFSFSQKEILEFNNFEILYDFENDFHLISSLFNISFLKQMVLEFKSKKKWTSELWIIISFTFWLRNKINE